jgi:hypothetical protein
MNAPSEQESGFENLPLRLAYIFLAANGLAAEATEIRTSQERLGSYTSSRKHAKIVAVIRHRALLDAFIDRSWKFARTAEGNRILGRYEKIYSRYEQSGGTDVSAPGRPAEEDSEAGTKFALEAQLRDYLEGGLGTLEPGLSLWPVENGDAVEFQLDDQGPSRRIDILAKDGGGIPVIVELKVGRGHEKTVGQALYYRARIKRKFNVNRVRIFIVAAEISAELRDTASEVSDVILFEYTLSVNVAQVSH